MIPLINNRNHFFCSIEAIITENTNKTDEIETTTQTTKINELKTIDINLVEQWISIYGNDTSNPILLILHGWAWYAMLPLFHDKNEKLEDYFTVVNLD